MITESFLNSCYSLIFNKNQNNLKKVIYKDIANILNFYQKKVKNDIPILIKNKVECLEKICQMKYEDRTNDNIIDSLFTGEKFRSLEDFIKDKLDIEMDENTFDDINEQIKIRKTLISLFSNYDKVADFIDNIKNGSFSCLDDVVGDYTLFVKKMYSDLMEIHRTEDIESSSSLDIIQDDFSSVIDQIKKKYEYVNVVPSGYDYFDNHVLRGGFEKSRLYIIGGGSGSGKSTLMSNFIENSLIMPRITKENENDVSVYITLENLIDESLMRMYQSLFMVNSIQFLKEISSKEPEEIKNRLLEKINSSNSSLVLKYFPKFSLTPTDIMMVLDSVIEKYGKNGIRSLVIDYLDLLAIDGKFEAYRHELSHITSQLKNIAVEYNIPVITATQLGRDIYSRNMESKDLNLSLISEAIKKVDHADFVALMSKDQVDDSLVHFSVGKNRCGRSNVSLDFKVNFECYKFINCYEVSNSFDRNFPQFDNESNSIDNALKFIDPVEKKKVKSVQSF